MCSPNHRLKQTSLVILLSCGMLSHLSYAAKPIDLSKASFPSETASHHLSAATSASAFHILKTHTDANQIKHVRVQQMHGGYPVFGADAVIHFSNQGNPSLLLNNAALLHELNNKETKKNGIIYADIQNDIGNQPPFNLTSETSKKAAIEAIKQTFSKVNGEMSWSYENENANLVVYIDKENKAHWAYAVSFTAQNPHQMPKQRIAILDAETHSIYSQWNNIKTFAQEDTEEVIGLGYGGNPLLGQWQYGKDKPGLPITRKQNLCSIKDKQVGVYKITDYSEVKKSGNEFTFSCDKVNDHQNEFPEPEQGFLGRSNEAYSPVNDALHYGIVIKKLYQDWYGVPVLTEKDHSTPLLLSMNILYFEEGYENAFWASEEQKMFFGLGGDRLYPLVTLGIAAHEISHGFTDQHSNLIYKDQSGSLNESFSDMAISAATYYESNGKETDWTTGADVMKVNLGKDKKDWKAIRYFDNPTKDGRSIAHVKDFEKLQSSCDKASEGDPDAYQSCVVHLGSGVFNKAFYLLANSTGWNPKVAFSVAVKANQDYWTSNSSFQAAACGMKQAAIDIAKTNAALPLDALDKAFKEVGISLSAC